MKYIERVKFSDIKDKIITKSQTKAWISYNLFVIWVFLTALMLSLKLILL